MTPSNNVGIKNLKTATHTCRINTHVDLHGPQVNILTAIPARIYCQTHKPSTHPPTRPRTHSARGPVCGPARLLRRGTASGHSQEVLHRDADDRAFHERPGRLQRQWRRRRRRWGRTLFLVRDFRRGLSRESSLGGQGTWGARFPARCRHPGCLSSWLWLPFPQTCSSNAPAPHSRAK